MLYWLKCHKIWDRETFDQAVEKYSQAKYAMEITYSRHRSLKNGFAGVLHLFRGFPQHYPIAKQCVRQQNASGLYWIHGHAE